MENSTNRVLVNTIVKKAIHDLKSDPERTVRNLIDMALQFADSRFQKEFYSIAQDRVYAAVTKARMDQKYLRFHERCTRTQS